MMLPSRNLTGTEGEHDKVHMNMQTGPTLLQGTCAVDAVALASGTYVASALEKLCAFDRTAARSFQEYCRCVYHK